MVDNILEDMQFAVKKPNFPDWNKGLVYGGWGQWVDTDKNTVKFSGPVKFRMKPVAEWYVSSQKGIALTTKEFRDKDQMMSYVWQSLEDGYKVTVDSKYRDRTFAEVKDRKLQYKTGITSEWHDLMMLGAESTFQTGVTFRVRPDHYYQVHTTDATTIGMVEFHDVDELCKYVDNRIRTNGLNFHVKKVAY